MAIDLVTLKEELNPEQYKAVTAIDGAILIIAGAGSGKTRVITYRIAHMLDMGIPQSQILALTFTNKAAKEMSDRVKELTQKKLQNLTVSTFHAFGVKILRSDIERLGYRENFSIYDETDRTALIKECGRELKFSPDALDIYKISTLFSNIKTGRKNWETANDMYRQLYESYQEGLKLYNAVDFDDLIVLPIKLFKEHPDILAKYKERYKYIMVDEFQDTSHQQYELMHLLADKNVAVVGDDDQSIYSWRGADYQNIINFEKDFDVQEIRLEQNYRSTETILEAANGVISHNTNRKDKKLWSGNGGGKPIEIFMPENETDEANFIAESIQGIAMEDSRKYDEFGVLIRANTQSRFIEEAFLQANIPYTMSGGTSFFERKEIKDVISYLRVIANHDDDINLLRIINTPRRGIGRATIQLINDEANKLGSTLWTAIQSLLQAQDSPASETLKEDLQEFVNIIENNRQKLISGRGLASKVRALVEEINYKDHLVTEYSKNEKAVRFKLMNIESLLNSMETWENDPDNFNPSLFTYLNRITLLSRDDGNDENDKGKVNLMTIHASKGLEFPVVFIAGAEEGLIPHARSVDDNGGNVEEERRLFYVAITRARDKLLISSCQKRRKQQSIVECTPSRFLDEIPENLVEYHEPSKEVSQEKGHEYLMNMLSQFKK
ncbi:MAG: UvrD-helicase domain-containing protein [Treponema sp.]|jgi:DNA helicase-2/ATP-dependent DNA helicase PcrA|nr:UvrD-helicase domain-containing protein [Treponema sp.]MBQ1971138.1 UvrD-helicase domain-containing protein [Treponema sp.]MEE1058536.1 3'-5' exonuclease [Treponema sp.]